MPTSANDQAATLIWVERGQTPRETQFKPHGSSSLSHHPDVETAIDEAMRVLSSGLSDGWQPWIMSQGKLLDPNAIQLAHGRASSHLDALARY